MNRLIAWLGYAGVSLSFPVFDEYAKAVSAMPSGKERLHCSRVALRRYDATLGQINLRYHNRIIDACFEIGEIYGELIDDRKGSALSNGDSEPALGADSA